MSGMLTLVLLGGSAMGKSATGNTVLGRRAFESRSSLRPVTIRVSESMEQVHGQQISVVDTPGILNRNALDMIRPVCGEYLHRLDSTVFLVVQKVDRVTADQIQALEKSMELLGEEGMRRSLLLFTHGAALEGQALEDFISEDEVSRLPEIFTRFGERHHVFDNVAGEPDQVQTLLQKIQRLLCPLSCSKQMSCSLILCLSPEDIELHTELRLVLLGLPGAGKSSTGNTVLGPNKFKTSCGFNSVSIVSECKTETVLGRQVKVVDTPGFSDEAMKPKKLFKCIIKSVLELTVGPHAFIIVVRLGRMNPRDTKLLELIPKLFDEVASKFTMVLFTHGDDLGDENIEDLIKNNNTMKTLVQTCERRYFVFNNKSRDRLQVRQLFEKIDQMIQNSGEDQCNSRIFELTTPEKIKEFFKQWWSKHGSCFCCCVRANADSDEEMHLLSQPLDA
ncbi:hypothetical protein WMY93_032988 [Mugilogobius chulae]|uniref:GTPase IMAP family member 8 n=1 Tax=Mugilogobius chulae TaxID=88201 RepID=A0AAW0MI71_9GOBI